MIMNLLNNQRRITKLFLLAILIQIDVGECECVNELDPCAQAKVMGDFSIEFVSAANQSKRYMGSSTSCGCFSVAKVCLKKQ